MVVVAAAVGILTVGTTVYLSRSPSRAPEAATTQSGAPSGSVVAPVAETALQGLLLSPDQLDTATGATGMTVTGSITALPEGSGQVPDKACVPLEGPGQATVYADSGFAAVSGQRAADQQHAHLVEQIVVLFSPRRMRTHSSPLRHCAGRRAPAGNTTKRRRRARPKLTP